MERRDLSFAETVAEPSSSSVSHISSSSDVDEGRFLPGTLLGGRYRIIGLLGRGGMGEVYRATDLALGQSVALKFLPEEAAQDQRLLERFHAEVRIARQVSHPNVCRVYDIGQAEGMPFISMEYVDGEDLSSLLLRIGRLPADKALETARKLCAGLAAAHDRGIIHRDLKPQNIMMNKRGDVVIMDFGLAAIADQLSGAEVRNGTPAYMAPEQLRGAEVTAKSDIYALGLVLYELFTGKRPFDAGNVQAMLRQQESAQLTSMTSIAADIDPGVEKAIRRCLDPDPARRPANVLSVAAALPGGDPLAAALAAGELPSPEMVASAGKLAGLAPRYSIPCLIAVIVCLCAAVALRARYAAVMHTPLDNPPEVLAHQARQMAASFGYPKRPADSALSLENRDDLLDRLKQLPQPHRWDEWLAAEAPIFADYRESLSPLIADPYGEVTPDNPAPTQPGMARVTLDGAGRLREFQANPYKDAPALTPAIAPEAVFRAAGLDMASFAEIPATFVPAGASSEAHSWKGPHPRIPGLSLTVDLALWKGRVTQLAIRFDWPKAAAATETSGSLASRIRGIVLLSLSALGLLSVVLLARRNWKLGHIDRKGALRIGIARCLLGLVTWIGTVHPVPDESMIPFFFANCAAWLTWGAVLALLYVALEPLVRARWPHSIVTWNRLLAGRWLDAQVGSHILIGATVGAVVWVAAEGIGDWQSGALGTLAGISSALGTRQWLAALASLMQGSLLFGLLVFFSICGLRRLVKKDVAAAILAALLLLFANGGSFSSPDWKITAAIYIGIYSVLLFVLLRLGLVATMAATFFIDSFNLITLGWDWKTWYAPSGLATFLLLLGIAIFAFWRSLGSHELFSAAPNP
ncbi:MAG TPA: serine/threonine-protein kinase [Bryobacteraceae bacterium]|nr:serine/threonine-protein kinase [Bryobacteraceae bacterium]